MSEPIPPTNEPGTPPPAAPQPVNYQSPGAGLNIYEGPPPDKDAKTWGMLAHLSALVQLIGLPSIIGPLVIWLIKKNEMPFVDDQGKEALNFQITVLLAALIISPTVCLAGLGIILLIALVIAELVLSIVAAMKANEGIAYRYPWTLRLIK